MLVLGILVVFLARRTYAMVQGARYSAGRLFGFTGFYVFLFALLAIPTLYAAVGAWGLFGWLLLAPYVAVPAAAAVMAVPYVRRIVRFDLRGEGRWYYHLPLLIPVLYLKGISTGDFAEALSALLGPNAGGLSASTIARLKEVWADEHARWLKRDLSVKRYVYFWADGIYVQARLEDEAQCLLVIIGAT